MPGGRSAKVGPAPGTLPGRTIARKPRLKVPNISPMAFRFPEGANSRFMNLMTIARIDPGAANDEALVDELCHGEVTLLVPAEKPGKNGKPGVVTFTHVFEIRGERTLLAFTSETALKRFATEDMCCAAVAANELVQACMGEIDVIVLDPGTPNEMGMCLDPLSRKAS